MQGRDLPRSGYYYPDLTRIVTLHRQQLAFTQSCINSSGVEPPDVLTCELASTYSATCIAILRQRRELIPGLTYLAADAFGAPRRVERLLASISCAATVTPIGAYWRARESNYNQKPLSSFIDICLARHLERTSKQKS